MTFAFHPVADIFPRMSASDLAKAHRLAKQGAVYAIRDDERQAVKLGWSFDPVRRMLQLQTAVPHQLRIIAFVAGTKKVERGLHDLFNDLHIRGEWFSDKDGEVSDVMIKLSADGY